MPITVTHAKSNIVADYTGVVTVGNSSGGTQTMQATDLIRPQDWNSAHQGTLRLTGSEIGSLFAAGAGVVLSTDASGVTFGQKVASFFEPVPLPNVNSTLSVPGIGTWYIDPVELPNGLDSGHIRMPVTMAAGFLQSSNMSAAQTASITHYQSLQHVVAFYKQGTGANATRLESVWSGQNLQVAGWELRVSSGSSDNIQVSNYLSLSMPYTVDQSGNAIYTNCIGSSTLSVSKETMTSTSINSMIASVQSYISGSVLQLIPFNTSLPAGQYWFAHMFTSTSSATGSGASSAQYIGGRTMFSSCGELGLLENRLSAFRLQGSSTTNVSTAVVPFHGYVATTSSAPINTLGTSDIRETTGRVYWNYCNPLL